MRSHYLETLTIGKIVSDAAVSDALSAWKKAHGKIILGFGHRFHKPTDPRAPRLIELVDQAVDQGACEGKFAKIAQEIETELRVQKGMAIPINIDGATVVIYAELGFAPPLARGLFCLSRSVGILAHSWEQMNQGGRNN